MAQLWEWEAVYKDGSVHEHQSEEKAGIASEAGMLAHLKRHFPSVTITKLRRCEAFEPKKDRKGPVHRSAFQSGLWDMGMRELMGLPLEEKHTILDRIRRERAAKLTGLRPDQIRPASKPISQRIIPITQRIQPIV